MQVLGTPSQFGLENHGLTNLNSVYWNLSPADLVEHAIRRQEGILSPDGALVVNTGQHTGRSPNDKFVVQEGTELDQKIWWGKVNQPISAEKFDRLYQKRRPTCKTAKCLFRT